MKKERYKSICIKKVFALPSQCNTPQWQKVTNGKPNKGHIPNTDKCIRQTTPRATNNFMDITKNVITLAFKLGKHTPEAIGVSLEVKRFYDYAVTFAK